MKACPYCQASDNQVKAGYTEAGSQRYLCKHCRGRYTPEPKQAGYSAGLRQQAVCCYVDGMTFRCIARHLGVNHQTVINWVNAYAATLPDEPPKPDTVTVIEQDELFTFVGDKKAGVHLDASGARRQLHCRVGRYVHL